jgi:hypothetical protein
MCARQRLVFRVSMSRGHTSTRASDRVSDRFVIGPSRSGFGGASWGRRSTGAFTRLAKSQTWIERYDGIPGAPPGGPGPRSSGRPGVSIGHLGLVAADPCQSRPISHRRDRNRRRLDPAARSAVASVRGATRPDWCWSPPAARLRSRTGTQAPRSGCRRATGWRSGPAVVRIPRKVKGVQVRLGIV